MIAFKKKAWVGYLFVLLTAILDTLWMNYEVTKYGLRAGPLAEENWNIFAILIQKPFFKLVSLTLGITFAFQYQQILEYRKLKTDAERKEKYPTLDKLHRSNFL